MVITAWELFKAGAKPACCTAPRSKPFCPGRFRVRAARTLPGAAVVEALGSCCCSLLDSGKCSLWHAPHAVTAESKSKNIWVGRGYSLREAVWKHDSSCSVGNPLQSAFVVVLSDYLLVWLGYHKPPEAKGYEIGGQYTGNYHPGIES